MQQVRAELYVPSVAKYSGDLATRQAILNPARQSGIRTAGFLLVLLGEEDLEHEVVQKQLGNLGPYVGLPASIRPAIKLMHPWSPLTGTRQENYLNFLTHPSWSRDYVAKSIEFASQIPEELVPPSGKAVSFHLSAYLTPDQWRYDPDYWARKFENVTKAVEEVCKFGIERNVRIHVENVPIPPFGDWLHSDESRLADSGYFYSDLGTPWPGLPWRKEIEEIRRTGAFWTIDVCHLFMALQGVKDASVLATKGLRRQALLRYMLYSSDLDQVDDSLSNYSDVVLSTLQDKDMVHLNQAIGEFKDASLHGISTAYGDSSPLHLTGNIPRSHLDRIAREVLGRDLAVVIEVNEKKGTFDISPNTSASLEYVLGIAKG